MPLLSSKLALALATGGGASAPLPAPSLPLRAAGTIVWLPKLILKSSDAVVRAPWPSLAVTRTLILPLAPAGAVPLKVCVAASNLSQAGSALPFAKVAE